MIFAERKPGARFEVCFDFKHFCNIDVYLLSLLPLFSSPGSLPSPCCGLLRVRRELAGLARPGWAGLLPCKGRMLLLPAVAHIARATLIAALGKLQAPAPSRYKHGVRHRAAMGVFHHRAGGKPPSLALA